MTGENKERGANTGAVGRFAPTPSGRLHLGNLLCAMLAYLSVKSRGGKFLLRIEDLDAARCKMQPLRQTVADLRLFGIDFDGEIICQSRRAAVYEKYVGALRKARLTYPCFCTRGQLHAAAAPHLSDGSYIYDGRCAALSADEIAAKRKIRPACERVRVPDRTITFNDGVKGECSQNLARECGDFIIRRSDGVFAYQLAVVVDDGESGVTEVVRGDDLLSSTARQIWLFEVLGLKAPKYFHIPLLYDYDGRRLSKREGDSVGGVLRRYAPEEIIGALSFAAGLSESYAPCSVRQLIKSFDFSKLGKDGLRLPRGFIGE